jgi:hypothetical protein
MSYEFENYDAEEILKTFNAAKSTLPELPEPNDVIDFRHSHGSYEEKYILKTQMLGIYVTLHLSLITYEMQMLGKPITYHTALNGNVFAYHEETWKTT